MRISDEEREILQRNIEDGKNAERAYEIYIKDFLIRSRQKIYSAFETISINDKEKLLELKLLMVAVKSLEEEIQSEIYSKKMAQDTLSQDSGETEDFKE